MTTRLILYAKKYRGIGFLAFTCIIVGACANMASPTGGDYDLDPPVVLRSSPGLNATRVTGNKIEIIFDELVQVENPNEKVIVTPPQRRTPQIQAINNKLVVQLRDTLLPNTTYTIDFTDAVADNNEKNVIENFFYSFSTGDEVDSLAVSGKVLSAKDLEPVTGMYVGLHSDLSDSAFIKKTFERISRTNDKGEFSIKGIKEGKYRLYALEDPSRSFKYDNTRNAIAFLDSIVVPSHIPAMRIDTVFDKDMKIDTILQVPYTRFLPDNLLLRSFVSAFQRQYLQKHERPSENILKIIFGGATKLAEVKPLNFDGSNDWYVLERPSENDSLIYWITDTLAMKMDTLLLQVNYQITDSLNNIAPATDTLRFANRKVRQQKNGKDNLPPLSLTSNMGGTMNVYDNIIVNFGQPVSDFDSSKFVLQRQVDTLFVDEKIAIAQDSLNPSKYIIKHKWKPSETYRFVVDSAAFHSYTGLVNNKFESSFQIKSLEEYGNLYINILGLRDSFAFVELLRGDSPIRKAKVKDGGALFMNLDPGLYYARIILDTNNNYKWDTGDYFKKLQPEEVFYYNRSFDIKEYWNVEETWGITDVELTRQKPLDITKNKPQEKKTRRQQLEEQEKARQQQNTNSSSPMSIPGLQGGDFGR